jgi:hypothetical protein
VYKTGQWKLKFNVIVLYRNRNSNRYLYLIYFYSSYVLYLLETCLTAYLNDPCMGYVKRSEVQHRPVCESLVARHLPIYKLVFTIISRSGILSMWELLVLCNTIHSTANTKCAIKPCGRAIYLPYILPTNKRHFSLPLILSSILSLFFSVSLYYV